MDRWSSPVFENDDEALGWADEKRNARVAQGWSAVQFDHTSGSQERLT